MKVNRKIILMCLGALAYSFGNTAIQDTAIQKNKSPQENESVQGMVKTSLRSGVWIAESAEDNTDQKVFPRPI